MPRGASRVGNMLTLVYVHIMGITGKHGGCPDFNVKDFAEAGGRFRISVLRPGDFLKKVKA
jgi:hypothetical protein